MKIMDFVHTKANIIHNYQKYIGAWMEYFLISKHYDLFYTKNNNTHVFVQIFIIYFYYLNYLCNIYFLFLTMKQI